MMKIYLLKPIDEEGEPWVPWYDKAFGFVVRANDEEQARKLVARQAGDELRDNKKNPWRDETLTSCKEIGNAKVPHGGAEILLRDFKSA
jgi:hypothetical protein